MRYLFDPTPSHTRAHRRKGYRASPARNQHRPPFYWVLAFGLLAVACSCEPRWGSEAGIEGSRRAYVERLGIDSLSVERYTRSADGFEGKVVLRSPVTRVVTYRAMLKPDGTIGSMDVNWVTPPENPEGPPPFGFTITLEADSATLERRGGRDPGTTRLAVPIGAIPNIGTAQLTFAEMEQAVHQANAAGADSFPLHIFSAARAQVVPNAVVRLSPDSVTFDFFGSPILVRVDSRGQVLGRSGQRTTLKVVGERVEDIDLEALAADWAARDARGTGLGVASPRAEFETMIGGARLRVVYSRPAKRGREIWGGLVPWNEVWRTGANAATAFSTDRDLRIGGVDVPAGEYTLFSVYTPESAKLIINRQTGQSGTEYHPEQDLARIEMRRETLPEAVERFTIAVEPAAGGGALELVWDRTRFSVPILVKR